MLHIANTFHSHNLVLQNFIKILAIFIFLYSVCQALAKLSQTNCLNRVLSVFVFAVTQMWWCSSSVPENNHMHRWITETEAETGLKWIQVFGRYSQLMDCKKMISWCTWWCCFLSFLLCWSFSVVVVLFLLLLLVCLLAKVQCMIEWLNDSLHRHTHKHTFHSLFICRSCWHISQFDCQLSICFCSALWWKVATIVAIAKSQRQQQPMTSNSRCCN